MTFRFCVIVLVLWGGLARAQPADPALVSRVMSVGKITDRSRAESLVLAATAASNNDFSVELLLGLSYVESNYESTATSRLIAGKRHTGAWVSVTAPPGAVGNFFCGVTQAIAPTWKRCLELRDPAVAYAAAVSELGQWLQRSGSVQGALQGHGCGNAGMKGACKAYALRVFTYARRLEGPRPTT